VQGGGGASATALEHRVARADATQKWVYISAHMVDVYHREMKNLGVTVQTPLPFWSGETLGDRLPSLISPFEGGRVDCAAYTLAMGREVYVSPNDQQLDPASVSIRQLADREAFTIPPGQFAFLLTEEIVAVPEDAIAFISMKAKIKWRGLVNVSGFHVDPGFRGRLIFAVFNAGPVPVHLRQGQPIFLIWFAGLDKPTGMGKKGNVQEHIPAELITGISGELQSFAGLSTKIKDVEKTLGEKVHNIEKEQTYYRVIGVIALALVVSMVTSWIKDSRVSPQSPCAASTVSLRANSLDRPPTSLQDHSTGVAPTMPAPMSQAPVSQ